MPEHTFTATIEIIGVNPFVYVPDDVLEAIFAAANRSKGPIPIRGAINGQAYTQTLVRYQEAWRLYINTTMLKNSPKHVGEQLTLSVAYDPSDRRLPLADSLAQALKEDPTANAMFESLTPSLQHEINRYITRLKTEQSVAINTKRAINFLHGRGNFVGRTLPATKSTEE